jgi:hypothetical protein
MLRAVSILGSPQVTNRNVGGTWVSQQDASDRLARTFPAVGAARSICRNVTSDRSPRGGDVGAFHGNLPQVTQTGIPNMWEVSMGGSHKHNLQSCLYVCIDISQQNFHMVFNEFVKHMLHIIYNFYILLILCNLPF